MANKWIHATFDFIAFGRPYFNVHEQKDAAYRELGTKHREVNHEWYQAYGQEWDFETPFPKKLDELVEFAGELAWSPEKIEGELQVFASHDYLDRTWDKLNKMKRWYYEGFCYWVLKNPCILRDKFGVDIIKGKIHRVIDGSEIWEDAPEIITDYKKLKAYARIVFKNKPQEFHKFYRGLAVRPRKKIC